MNKKAVKRGKWTRVDLAMVECPDCGHPVSACSREAAIEALADHLRRSGHITGERVT